MICKQGRRGIEAAGSDSILFIKTYSISHSTKRAMAEKLQAQDTKQLSKKLREQAYGGNSGVIWPMRPDIYTKQTQMPDVKGRLWHAGRQSPQPVTTGIQYTKPDQIFIPRVYGEGLPSQLQDNSPPVNRMHKSPEPSFFQIKMQAQFDQVHGNPYQNSHSPVSPLGISLSSPSPPQGQEVPSSPSPGLNKQVDRIFQEQLVAGLSRIQQIYNQTRPPP